LLLASLTTALMAQGVAHAATLSYHNGPVLVSAKAVFIFWGPSFQNPASPDYLYARDQINFRNQFGTTPEYNVITQYYENPGKVHIQLTNLGAGTPDWFDTSTPPTNVTDAIVQGEVNRYLAAHAFNAETAYEVFIPSTSYSSDGSATSCGGPNLAYCAYHSFYSSGANSVMYAIVPSPSCAGCQVSGLTLQQNAQLLVCRETREAVTDPELNGWYTSNGGEADSQCGGFPPFVGTGGFYYGWEWSNASNACVKTR
jgi:hypothetical protein